ILTASTHERISVWNWCWERQKKRKTNHELTRIGTNKIRIGRAILPTNLQSLSPVCKIFVSAGMRRNASERPRGPIAQSVEQMAFNHWVEGSSPSRITISLETGRLPVRRPFFFVSRYIQEHAHFRSRFCKLDPGHAHCR